MTRETLDRNGPADLNAARAVPVDAPLPVPLATQRDGNPIIYLAFCSAQSNSRSDAKVARPPRVAQHEGVTEGKGRDK
jgi:hypothetical protein